MKDAITKLIVTHINHVGAESAVSLSEYVKMPLGKLTDYLFNLVDCGILDYDPQSYMFCLGKESNILALDSDSEQFAFLQLEPFRADAIHPQISSKDELCHYLKFDENHYSEARSYHTFRVMGKNRKKLQKYEVVTKWRDISAPSLNLKTRQRWILDNILTGYVPPECVHGFVKGKSIKTNAYCHINMAEIGCIDIADFFPSISFEMVKNVYLSMGYSQEVSNTLAKLTTYQGKLPQGAPTSPMLSNIIMKPIDVEIMRYAKENGLVYSRYADDITVSGNEDIEKHLCRVINIVEKKGFKVNAKKTRIMNAASGKKVTGLSVDTSVRVPNSFKRKLRQEIYFCKKFGVAFHLRNSINPDDRSINFMGYLYGKAYFIRMVEPQVGEEYIKQLNYIFDCEE